VGVVLSWCQQNRKVVGYRDKNYYYDVKLLRRSNDN
jgi:hypothetical protein